MANSKRVVTARRYRENVGGMKMKNIAVAVLMIGLFFAVAGPISGQTLKTGYI
jgi:hypothetical protein